jgi:hypothetical protein
VDSHVDIKKLNRKKVKDKEAIPYDSEDHSGGNSLAMHLQFLTDSFTARIAVSWIVTSRESNCQVFGPFEDAC